MASSFSFLSSSLLLLLLLHTVMVTINGSFTDYVSKDCGVPNSREISINKANLFSRLVAESSNNYFSATRVGNEPYEIVGLYRCKDNLTKTECQTCVSSITSITINIEKHCGNVLRARVQLKGCYLHYQLNPFVLAESDSYMVAGQECGPKNTPVSTDGPVAILGYCDASNGCSHCLEEAFDSVKDRCRGSVSGNLNIQHFPAGCSVNYTLQSPYPSGAGAGAGAGAAGAVKIGLWLWLLCLLSMVQV